MRHAVDWQGKGVFSAAHAKIVLDTLSQYLSGRTCGGEALDWLRAGLGLSSNVDISMCVRKLNKIEAGESSPELQWESPREMFDCLRAPVKVYASVVGGGFDYDKDRTVRSRILALLPDRWCDVDEWLLSHV